MPRASTTKTRSPDPAEAAEPRDPLPPVRAMMALAGLDRRGHVAVLGEGGLDTALALWRAGFVHVDVVPERLSRPALGMADAVIVAGSAAGLESAIGAARGVLRVGGWLIVRVQRTAADGVRGVRRSLRQAGFAPGGGVIEAEGAWIAARRRPEFTLHVSALKSGVA